MKKNSRLRLHSETLLRLDAPLLRAAAGSDTVVTCSGRPTICNPSHDTGCESACLMCPSREPTIEP